VLKNYLRIAWRSLWRDRGYAALNIVGLAVGLATCLVIGLYVQHEWSYDRFHPDAERTYRLIRADPTWDTTRVVTAAWTDAALRVQAPGPSGNVQTPPGLAEVVAQQFPEVEAVTYVGGRGSVLLSRDDTRTYVDGVLRADAQFFEVFGGFELLQGQPGRVLDGPKKAVLTASMAERLFGTTQAVGETFTLDNRTTYTVTGIAADPPSNSHVDFSIVRSTQERRRTQRTGTPVDWVFFDSYRYVKLRPGADPAALQQKLQAYAAANGKPDFMSDRFVLQALPSIHLFSAQLNDDIAPQSDVRYLYFFGLVALLLLGIAGVNYTNLATARAMRRAREVGVRKTMGAQRSQLVGQFLGEATLATAVALPLALVLAAAAVPLVNRLADQALSAGMLAEPAVLAVGLGAVLLVGLVAGSYPAFVLARFHPVDVLGGRSAPAGAGRGWLRKGLIVLQFAASVVLIIGTFAVQQQLGYIQEKRLGFDEERVITFRSDDLGDQYGTFKTVAEQQASVQRVSAGPPPGTGNLNRTIMHTDEATGERTRINVMRVDYGYLDATGMALKAGRTFQRDRPTDADEGVVVTEAAVEALGLGDSPVGTTFTLSDRERTVIGVIADFHNESLHEPVQPVVLDLEPGNQYNAVVRLASGQTEAGLDAVRDAWSQLLPERPFTYAFLDQQIEAQYRAEQRLGRLFVLFAGLAVGVAALGLFGLVAYATRRRTREIGIRKVLGATVSSIVGLLSREFLLLVAAAFLVAAPLAYLGVQAWMQQFAYRAPVGWELFLGAGACVAGAALLVTGIQAARAALTDPVRAIRQE
jgi:putative ABC transport system permease protein